MKNIKKIITLILITFLLIAVMNTSSYAAGSFSISASKSSMNKGENATLTINVADCEGQLTISSSDSNIVSVSKDKTWLGRR